MKTYKRLIKYSILLTIMFLLIGMRPNPDIFKYVGKNIEDIPDYLLAEMYYHKVYLEVNEIGSIITISTQSPHYTLGDISVGDKLSKVTIPNEQAGLRLEEDYMSVPVLESKHFGVVTQEMRIYFSEERINKLEKRYIADKPLNTLPITNEAAIDAIEGEWLSDKNRTLTFNRGILSDNILDTLWNKQYYQVVAPNELLITRKSNLYEESHRMYFWVTEKYLYLFAIDSKGIPLNDTLETFIRK